MTRDLGSQLSNHQVPIKFLLQGVCGWGWGDSRNAAAKVLPHPHGMELEFAS